MLLLVSIKGLGQTNPTAQNLPYTQNFGTATFTSMPAGMAAWNSTTNRITQAAAEGAQPGGNATIAAQTAPLSTGGVHGYASSSNARAYIQQSSNATNGNSMIAVAINTGTATSISVSYQLELINVGVTTQDFGHSLQYRLGITGAWTTISGSAMTFGAVTSYTTSTRSFTVTGLAASSVYQIRWVTWRPDGTGASKGIGIDNISIAAAATVPLAPTINSITPGDGQLSVAFTTGGNGGSAITNYKYSTNGGISFTACSPAQTTSPIIITGLTNGTSYNVQIRAVNAIGDGAATASTAGTPVAPSVNPTFNAYPSVNKNYGDANGFAMTASSDSSGSFTYTSSNTNVATITNAGIVTIKAVGTTTINANQAAALGFNAGSTSTTLTVNQALTGLTITANGVSKTYGTTISGGSSAAFTVSGLLYSDTLGTSPSVTNTYGIGAAVNDSATLSMLSPAIYTDSVTPSNLTNGSGATYNAANYAATTYISGDITVNKANQFITFSATDSKVYGTADYAPNATSSTSGINAISYSSSNTNVAEIVSGNIHIVGVGTVTITASQATDDNYNATTADQTLTVIPKNLTITGITANNKPFDGNTIATLSGTPSLVGIVGSDDVTLTGTPMATFVSSAIDSAIQVDVTDYNLNGTTAVNYSLTQPTLFADIFATTATIFTSGTLTAVNTTYGSPSTTPTNFNVSGQSLAESILVTAPIGFEVSLSNGSSYGTTVTVGGAGTIVSTPIYVRLASTTAAGTYSGDVTLSSSGATSVTIATVSSTVSPKELTFTGLIGVDKTYDTTTTATVTGTATLNGIVGLDDVAVNNSSVTYNFDTANAGTNKPITAVGFTLDGASSTNYTLAQPIGITATILKAASTISVTGANAYTYDALPQGPSTSTVTGSTEAVTYLYTGVNPVVASSASKPTNAGSYTVVATVATDTNYESATSTEYAFIINKAEQIITLEATDTRTASTTSYTLTQNATSGLAILYTTSDSEIITISGNTVTIVGPGNAIITANQGGNENYNAALQKTQILSVTQPICISNTGNISWTFATASPSTSQPNVTVGALSQGNNNGTTTLITSVSASSGYSGSTGTNNAGAAVPLGALNNATSTHFAFTITPTAGYNFTLNNISFGTRSTGSGPQLYTVRSSADNYSTNLVSGSISNNSTWQLKSHTGINFVGQGNGTPITFRIYGTNGTGNPGADTANWRIDDLNLNLTVSNTPSVATAGSNQTICGLTSTSLGGNTPQTGTGTWSQVSGVGTTTFSSVNSGASTATASEVGTYVYRWTIANGCSTTFSADVTVIYNAVTTNTTTISTCDSYTWTAGNGTTYTTSGTYTYVNGCTTEILDLTIAPSTANTTTISACDAYTWTAGNGNTYTASGTYSFINGCHTETLELTINSNSIVSQPSNASLCMSIGATATFTTASGSLNASFKWYSQLVNDDPLTGTWTLLANNDNYSGTTSANLIVTKTEPTVPENGTKYRVVVTSDCGVITSNYAIISDLPIPATPSTLLLTNDNAVLPATPSTPVTAIAIYVGTETEFRLTATAVDNVLYQWTLPLGMTSTSTDPLTGLTITNGNTIFVKFSASSATTPLLPYVQTINTLGCYSIPKATAPLTRILPTAPVINMNNGITTAPITSFAPYMGTNTVLRLSLTSAVGATSYEWELPEGVVRMTALSGGTVTTSTSSVDPFIYVNFSGVTNLNTSSYTPTSGVLTHVLRIGAKSKNGVGVSITTNSSVINPTTTSTAKLMTLIAVKPSPPAVLSLNNGVTTTAITTISGLIGNQGIYRLSASAATLASAYEWELPFGVTRVSGLNDETVENSTISTAPFIYVKFTDNVSVAYLQFGVKAINGVGSSINNNTALTPTTTSTAKLLRLATTVPVAPTTLTLNDGITSTAITAISKLIGEQGTYRLSAATSTLANSYEWELPNGVTRVTALDGLTIDNATSSVNPFIYVKFTDAVAPGILQFGVKALNGVGNSITNNVALLPATTSSARLLRLTVAIPVAPTSLVLSESGSTTAITVASKYIGKPTTLKLTAAPSVLANTYLWELPLGVTRTDLNGEPVAGLTSTDSFIYVNFSEFVVENSTTISLLFGVKALNNVGSSITINLAPNEASTARLLKVTAGLPYTVGTVTGDVSVCNRSEGYTYSFTATASANYYTITAPLSAIITSPSFPSNSSNILTTTDLSFTVVYLGTSAFSPTDKSLSIKSGNAFGLSANTRTLLLTKISCPTPPARMVTEKTDAFDVVAYPNPSTNTFQFNFTTNSDDQVEIKVYDMLGKLIETRQLNTLKNTILEVGNNYPSGIYNVVVAQGENIKTLRLIKK